jgi:hypothetical protein
MRDQAISLVIACMLGCGGARPAATGLGGDVQGQVSDCSLDPSCSNGGGRGSLVLPLVIIGATIAGIAAISYVNYLVRPAVRVTDPP